MTTDLDLRDPITSEDHRRGSGPPQLVVYGDFECPYTGAAVSSIARLADSGLAFEVVFRQFPLWTIHPHALGAAEAAEAAARQGRFWEMHDVLFRNQRHFEPDDLRRYAERVGLNLTQFDSDLQDPAIAARIERDVESGERSGVDGTPSIFIDGVRYGGARDAATLGEALREPRL
jgi:protein-disulfide isomerase